MFSQIDNTKVYTPQQVAQMLQLRKSTVYNLISRGDIIAKKIGKVYRIPASSLSFVFTGLDYDLYKAEEQDKKQLEQIEDTIQQVRQLS